MLRISKSILFVVVVALLLILIVGCGGTPAVEAPEPEVAVEATAVSEPEPTAESATIEEEMAAEDEEATKPEFVEFAAGNFSDPTNIDNKWLPLQPGTQWVLDGITVEEGEEIPHRIEFTVTDLIKEVAGVNTVVAWIVDISDGEVVEKEIAFYAQDDNGNVWYFGEHPVEYEDGEFVEAPTWIANVEEALPGVKMWADPQMDAVSYFQGWAPEVEWSDYGQIDEVGAENCVALDCYEDVMVIAESSLEEPDIFQLKFYAPGVGNIRVGFRGDDATQEELELIELNQLDAAALAAIAAEALALDAHAYEVSPDVYGDTAPATPNGG